MNEEDMKKKIVNCGNINVKVPYNAKRRDFIGVSNILGNVGGVMSLDDDVVEWRYETLYLLDNGFNISNTDIFVNYDDIREVKIVKRGGWFSIHSILAVVTKDKCLSFKIVKTWANAFKSVLEEKIK